MVKLEPTRQKIPTKKVLIYLLLILTYDPSKMSIYSRESLPATGIAPVSDPGTGRSVHVFPNPAGSFVELQIFDEQADIQYLSIVSMNGQVHKSITIPSNHFRLDLQDLQNGLYLFQFFSPQNALIDHQKILVLH